MSEPAAGSDSHPVRLIVNDDLRRSRLTVFFRGWLVIPHLIWYGLYGIPVFFVRLVAPWIGLFRGRLSDRMHGYLGRYVRYGNHIAVYRAYAANPYPPFNGREGGYVVDLALPEAQPQNRFGMFFRFFLAIPAIIVVAFWAIWYIILWIAAFFYALFMGRMAPGLERGLTNFLRYSVQVTAYTSLLTSRYPQVGGKPELNIASADPAPPPATAPGA